MSHIQGPAGHRIGQESADQGITGQRANQSSGPAAHRDAAPGDGSERVWSVDEHLEDILGSMRPLDPLDCQILDAQGCVLVEDVTVASALPPFDNSSMDGYAVRVADVAEASTEHPAVLRVVADIAAGSVSPVSVRPGECARIMTGAPVPPGAEAVVPVEWTDGGSGSGPVTAMPAYHGVPDGASGEVKVFRAARAGGYIRRLGSDVAVGQRALRAGVVLGPPQIGLLAAIGRQRVQVRPRPRVVVISTGSELVQPGEALGEGRIADSNSFSLTAAARDAGAVAYRVGAVSDEPHQLIDVITDQFARADLIVTSGGVSVGAYDVVKEAFAQLGWVEFRRLAMQPGKPQGFGHVGPDGIPLCALPGNPVSAYVSFELFVRPAIRRLMGMEPVCRPMVNARLAADVASSPSGKRQFLRGRYDPTTRDVTPVGGSGSHLVAALAQANALIMIPETVTAVAAGASVEVVLLP